MLLFNQSFDSPPQNLACDEALLDWCEAGFDQEILRFWEPAEYFVVLGYTNKVLTEVNEQACRARNILILRRCSGGGTVLQGPGCLNYSLILKIPDDVGPLAGLTETNRFIMERHARAMSTLLSTSVTVQGYTDLTINGRKFSGNAQRRKKRFLLFHGAFLLNFDIALIEQVLRLPDKQPEYRAQRSHTEFLTNLNVSSDVLKAVLRDCWNATQVLDEIPYQRMEQLVAEKYSRAEWNFKF